MDALTTTTRYSSEEIFVILKKFITEVIGAEFAEDMDITRESSFTRDLEMDSIEMVAFSEKVKLHFGPGIDFTGWLSNMDIDQLIALNLNDIIQYIQQCQ